MGRVIAAKLAADGFNVVVAYVGNVDLADAAGTRTENCGPEQDDLNDVDVSVRPARALTYLRHEWNCCTTTWGTRRPIPHDTASNDIVATHSVVRVASLRATAAALARHGTPLTGDDLMMLHGGIRAVLVAGPDGHRFLVEERAAPATYAAPGPAQARE